MFSQCHPLCLSAPILEGYSSSGIRAPYIVESNCDCSKHGTSFICHECSSRRLVSHKHDVSQCEGSSACKAVSVAGKLLTEVAIVQPKESGAPKTGDMMMGRPVAKFYEAVTTTEQTLF